jgi:hypothetical protein
MYLDHGGGIAVWHKEMSVFGTVLTKKMRAESLQNTHPSGKGTGLTVWWLRRIEV